MMTVAQAVRIQEQLCPGSEEMALTTYQYGTLQYVRGLHARAEELCSSSLALSRRLYLKDSSSQVRPESWHRYNEAQVRAFSCTGRLIKCKLSRVNEGSL